MKSLINIPLLKEQLKRFWAIGVVFTLVYLLFVALPVYSTADIVQAPQHLARAMIDLLSMSHPVLMFSMLIAPFCTAMALYPYHFNANAATAFHAFPINKKQMFWTNMAAAFILLLLPMMIFCLVILIPVYYPGPVVMDLDGVTPLWSSYIFFPRTLFPWIMTEGDIINTIPVVAGFFARMSVALIFYFSVFLLAVSISGNRVVAILLSGALPLIPAGLFMLGQVIASVYVFGYDNTHMDLRGAAVLAYTNPVMWESAINNRALGWRFHFPEGTPALFQYFMAYIGITVALIAAAYTCSHKRKLERAGDSVVFNAVKKVCVFLVATVGMVITGPFLMHISHSHVGLYAGFVLGFFIAYFIAQMIAEKTFDVRHKVKALLPYSIVMAVLYITVLGITHFGMPFYVNRVPQVSEVQGVALHNQWRTVSADRRPYIYADDPEAIAHALEIHRRIIENRHYLQSIRWRAITRSEWADTLHLPVTYLMRDGTTMYRQYVLSRSFAAYVGLPDLMSNPAMVLSPHPAFRRPEVIETIIVNYRSPGMFEGSGRFDITESSEILSLLEAIRADLIVATTNEWYVMTGGTLSHQEPPIRRDLGINILVHDRYLPRYNTGHVFLGGAMENTLEWLHSHRYLDRDGTEY